jgi:hypothetical protein
VKVPPMKLMTQKLKIHPNHISMHKFISSVQAPNYLLEFQFQEREIETSAPQQRGKKKIKQNVDKSPSNICFIN